MRVLVAVADGSEDIEAVTIIDVLRRAEFEVTVAAVGPGRDLVLARGCRLQADLCLDEARGEFDLVVLPGGVRGAENLAASAVLIRRLREQRDAGRLYAAICAAPALVLAPNGLLDGRQATCYPSFAECLPDAVSAPVVRDGPCITSQSPATAMAFALALVEALAGREPSAAIAAQMLYPLPPGGAAQPA